MTLVEEIMTVKEAILLCIKYDIKGAQSQLVSYEKANPNRLSTKNQINALKGNMECIYQNVTITGGGKRGKVIVSGLKDTIDQKEDNRSENGGQPSSAEQLLMNEYIHKLLYCMCKDKKYIEYGVNGWAKELGLINTDNLPIDHFTTHIKEVHANTSFNAFKPSQIAREFKEALYTMNTGVIDKSFKALSKSGQIEYRHNYNIVKSNGEKVIVDKYKYDQIKKRRMEVLKELGSNITEYFNGVNTRNPTLKVKGILGKVDYTLEEEFECKFIYQSYIVSSVSEDFKEVDEEVFTDVYWKDFIKRTVRRQSFYDNKYQHDTWMWRKLWAFNTLALLDYLGVDTGGLLLECEKENTRRINELSHAYQEWLDKSKPIGFGMINKEEYKKVDFS